MCSSDLLNTVALAGSTSGTVTLAAPAVAGTNTITFPAGTTNFGATGGTSQVVKQTSLGAAFTVAQLAASDLSNGTSGTGTVVLDSVTTTIKGGGLALTSQATYDLMYASSATQWVRIANGTTGQVLTATTSGAPAWATPSASGVTSFSAGSTGFTPNTATTGAITLAGTLGVGYGGTGLASYTIGDLLYASGTTTIAKLADVATGQVLTSGGVGAAPSYSANPTVSSVVLKGSTSGTTTVKPAAVAGTTTVTLPGGTTDFSATGGTSQVVKQTTAGGAFTVAQLAASDLSDGTTGSGKVVLDTSPTFQTSLSVPEVRGHSSGTATTIVTLSTNGKIKETNAAATAGVVRDLTTDGTMTVYQDRKSTRLNSSH